MSTDIHNNLIEILRLSWDNLDADLIEPFLAEDVHYSSWWALAEINNKEDYLIYLRERFQTFKDKGTKPLVKLGVNKNDGEYAVALQMGDEAPTLIRIKEEYGKIKEMWMQPAQ
ncbi:MAG: hypothetical protein IJM35_09980 [Bacteroidales bacterium]|nr:hypothetical protein [Bacteroidales bacterium]